MDSVRRTLISFASVTLLACGFEPANDQEIEPPAVFREWWAKTESCSGLQRRFENVRWYVVPGYDFECPSGRCVGRWQGGHRIYLAEAWADHEMVVRHEMLHELIGEPGHPAPPFGAGCPLTWRTWQGSAAPAAGHVAHAPGHLPHID